MDKELTPIQAKAVEILENKRFWTILAGCAFVLLASGFGRYYAQEKGKETERKAADKLFAVEKTEVEGIQPNPSVFTQDFMKKRLEWDAAKKETMKKELEAVVAEFPKTASAQSARIRLGSLAYQDSKFDDSIKNFDEVISHGTNSVSDVTYWTAKLGKAYVLETQKKNEEALKVYQEVSSNVKNPLAAEALLSEVRVLSALGRAVEIAPRLEKLKAEFPGTYQESAAKTYLPSAKSGS